MKTVKISFVLLLFLIIMGSCSTNIYDVDISDIDIEIDYKQFEKDLGKLEKKNSKLHSDIEKFKEKIKKAEAAIEENLVAQDEKRIEIAQQKKVIEEVIERLNKVGKDY